MKEPVGSTIRAMKPPNLAATRQEVIPENNTRHLKGIHSEIKSI